MRRLIITSLWLIAFFSLIVLRTEPVSAQSYRPLFRQHNVCAAAPAGKAHCNAIRLDSNSQGVTPNINSPSGYTPMDLQSAYRLPSACCGRGQTVAIIDAFEDPRAEVDLAIYRARFGLAACTTANGCFRKVNQNGGISYPPADIGWAQETSLDLDMASAICPHCHILLVEANSNNFIDLATAVNTAARLKANTISNSYGGNESSDETGIASSYYHPGTIITASSGDSGYGVQIPAAFNAVVAVGGTTLLPHSGTHGWSETAWSGSGSGCSAFISKPRWQTDRGCARRTVADVAAVADPLWGVSVYDSYGNVGGWLVFGGTSVSSPIIASVYALAGNASSIDAASSLYSHPDRLHNVTNGSNGSCGGSYLCTAGPGYNGPTGLGTPNGLGAF